MLDENWPWQGDGNDTSKRPKGKQQQQQPPCGLGEIAAPVKGKQERPKAGTKKKAEAASTAAAGEKTDYIHVRARRGQATDSHSLAERVLPTAQFTEQTFCILIMSELVILIHGRID